MAAPVIGEISILTELEAFPRVRNIVASTTGAAELAFSIELFELLRREFDALSGKTRLGEARSFKGQKPGRVARAAMN
jgi:hypothetical protein